MDRVVLVVLLEDQLVDRVVLVVLLEDQLVDRVVQKILVPAAREVLVRVVQEGLATH